MSDTGMNDISGFLIALDAGLMGLTFCYGAMSYLNAKPMDRRILLGLAILMLAFAAMAVGFAVWWSGYR